MTNSSAQKGRWLLPVLLTVQFVVSLDMSVVNVALPDIGRDIGLAPDALPWVINAYALAFGGLLMLGGRLADVIGGRRTLLAGFALFGAASLAGGLAAGPGWLIAARALQGAGAAALAPVAFTLLTVTYPPGAPRARALGLWGMSGAAGGAAGMLVGGLLTSCAGWRSVMLINVPVVVPALLAARRAVPAERRTGRAPRLDVAGAVLVTGGTSALVLGLVRTGTYGWTSRTTLLALAVSVALLTAFAVVELRVRGPLLRLGLLTNPSVLSANLFTLLMSSGQFAAFYFTSLYMQQVLGYGPTATGIAFLPFCAGVVAGSLLAPRAVARFGPGTVLVTGGLLGAAGLAWFALTVAVGSTFAVSVLGPSLVLSVGVGVCFVPLGAEATAGVIPSEVGMAAGVLNSSRQIGGSLGLSVLATVAVHVSSRAPHGGRAALADGQSAALWTAAALLVAASLAVALLRGRRRRATAPAEPAPVTAAVSR
ncbi:MFS transporter [Streptomyces sp. NBC_00344]|uniref:MFS transporter n=1 Tax=Streptomyces sp. NBC_00344 TaxID=2975720 RepID=UPI002E1B1A25